jgi:hypothetical protein
MPKLSEMTWFFDVHDLRGGPRGHVLEFNALRPANHEDFLRALDAIDGTVAPRHLVLGMYCGAVDFRGLAQRFPDVKIVDVFATSFESCAGIECWNGLERIDIDTGTKNKKRDLAGIEASCATVLELRPTAVDGRILAQCGGIRRLLLRSLSVEHILDQLPITLESLELVRPRFQQIRLHRGTISEVRINESSTLRAVHITPSIGARYFAINGCKKFDFDECSGLEHVPSITIQAMGRRVQLKSLQRIALNGKILVAEKVEYPEEPFTLAASLIELMSVRPAQAQSLSSQLAGTVVQVDAHRFLDGVRVSERA